jgi:hypothetical protein
VAAETVHFDGKPLFEFANGKVHLYDDSFAQKDMYPINWFGSALATVPDGDDIRKLTRFRRWLHGLIFRTLHRGTGASSRFLSRTMH